MIMKIKSVFPVLLLLAAPALAQLGSGFSKSPSVTFAAPAPVVVKPGGSGKVQLYFRVLPGFHINSNQPKGEFLLATAVRLDAPTDIVISRLAYPPGQDRSFPFAPNEKLNVYTGDFSVTGMVNTTRSVSPGTYRVHGTLDYQACDNAACYPPKKLPVDFDVKVVPPSSAVRRNPGQSPHVH